MTAYFPTRFALMRDCYDERLAEIGRAAIAAAKASADDRMDAVYATVRETLTNESWEGLGKNERRLREHLADELEQLCLLWRESGEVAHDIAGRLTLDDFVSERDPFADLRDSDVFEGVSYVHIGEGTGLEINRNPTYFIDGFFIERTLVGEEDGTILTFTCGIEKGAETVRELGPLLLASGRMVKAWIPDHAPIATPEVFGDPEIAGDAVMYHALTTAAASVRVTAASVRSFKFS